MSDALNVPVCLGFTQWTRGLLSSRGTGPDRHLRLCTERISGGKKMAQLRTPAGSFHCSHSYVAC